MQQTVLLVINLLHSAINAQQILCYIIDNVCNLAHLELYQFISQQDQFAYNVIQTVMAVSMVLKIVFNA